MNRARVKRELVQQAVMAVDKNKKRDARDRKRNRKVENATRKEDFISPRRRQKKNRGHVGGD